MTAEEEEEEEEEEEKSVDCKVLYFIIPPHPPILFPHKHALNRCR